MDRSFDRIGTMLSKGMQRRGGNVFLLSSQLSGSVVYQRLFQKVLNGAEEVLTTSIHGFLNVHRIVVPSGFSTVSSGPPPSRPMLSRSMTQPATLEEVAEDDSEGDEGEGSSDAYESQSVGKASKDSVSPRGVPERPRPIKREISTFGAMRKHSVMLFGGAKSRRALALTAF